MIDTIYDFRKTFLDKYTFISILLVSLIAVGTAYLVSSSGLLPKSDLDLLQVSMSEFGTLSGTLIPILATLSSYFFYGKDKTNGVIESIIALPVTRGRLIFSRFLANVSSLLLAFVVGIAVYQVVLFEEIGQYLPWNYTLFLVWAFLVEIAAYAGLVYLAAQFIDSQGKLLGFSVAVMLLFGIFWIGYIIHIALGIANIPVNSNAYAQYKLYFDAVSPGGYMSFSTFLLAPVNGAGQLLTAASLGVTPLTVFPLGIAWAVIPALLAILVGRKRD